MKKYDYIGPVYNSKSTWHKFFGRPEDTERWRVKVTSGGKVIREIYSGKKKRIEHIKEGFNLK